MGAYAAGDRLCSEFPTGQRLDMTSNSPTQKTKKSSRGTPVRKRTEKPFSRNLACLRSLCGQPRQRKKARRISTIQRVLSVVPQSEGPARSFPRHEEYHAAGRAVRAERAICVIVHGTAFQPSVDPGMLPLDCEAGFRSCPDRRQSEDQAEEQKGQSG